MNSQTFAFTTGPWQAGIQYDDEFGCPVMDKSGREVAEVKGESEEECGANARLVAGAPLMYETLGYAHSVAKREGWKDLTRVIGEALLNVERG
jgi:hypothetical protein